MDDLSSKMIMENNEGYSYYPLSNNDKYLVMVKRPSRDIDLMYMLDLESNEKIEISNQESNFWGQGFDKNDENYYYSTNYDNEFLYLMSYNIESGNRSLVYKTEWDVTRHFLTKNDKFTLVKFISFS